MNNHELNFGIHAVVKLLAEAPYRVKELLILKDCNEHRLVQLVQSAQILKIPITTVSRHKLESMLIKSVNHQGVVALCSKAHEFSEDDLPTLIGSIDKPLLLLVLDGVQDPHNLGACLRSADAAGVNAVIAPKDRCVGITPVVRKVASGGAETVPYIQVTNLVRTLKWLQKQHIWIFGTDGNAKQILYEMNLKGRVALVLGAEGSGLRQLTKEVCDYLMRIPMMGKVESLNVSVAAGICLFEVSRQRNNFLIK